MKFERPRERIIVPDPPAPNANAFTDYLRGTKRPSSCYERRTNEYTATGVVLYLPEYSNYTEKDILIKLIAGYRPHERKCYAV